MKTSLRLATRIFNAPLAILPAKGDVILSALKDRLGISADILLPDIEDEPEVEGVGYVVTDDGIAVIPVQGTLVKKTSGMNAMSGLTSYEELQEQLEDAATDPAVKGIFLDIDSPGGEAAGMFDFCDFLSSIRGQKPIYGIANDSAYSAAYAIASCCDRLFVTQSGGVGSIGCYMMHVDQSGYDKQNGLKFTYIFSGDDKVDGNPHEPLSADAKATLQDDVDRIRGMFVDTVARNRGVDAKSIYDTEAACFMAADAIPLLADEVGNKAAAMAALRAKIGMSAEVAAAPPNPIPFTKENLLKLASSVFSGQAYVEHLTLADEVMSGILARVDDTELIPLLASQTFGRGKPGWLDRVPRGDGSFLALRQFGSMTTLSDELTQRRIKGCLAPYGVLSSDLGGFKEVYSAGCFTDSVASRDDVKVLFNHDPNCVLGRRSAGTARIYEQEDGLYLEAIPPNTSWADDLIVSMERGDIDQMSAAFFILSHRWEVRGGWKVRVIEKAKLVEGSIQTFAAYESTTAASVAAPTQSAHQTGLNRARLELLKIA